MSKHRCWLAEVGFFVYLFLLLNIEARKKTNCHTTDKICRPFVICTAGFYRIRVMGHFSLD